MAPLCIEWPRLVEEDFVLTCQPQPQQPAPLGGGGLRATRCRRDLPARTARMAPAGRISRSARSSSSSSWRDMCLLVVRPRELNKIFTSAELWRQILAQHGELFEC